MSLLCYCFPVPNAFFISIRNDVRPLRFSSGLLVRNAGSLLVCVFSFVYSATLVFLQFQQRQLQGRSSDWPTLSFWPDTIYQSSPNWTYFTLLCPHLQEDRHMRLTNQIPSLRSLLNNHRPGCANHRLTILTRGLRLTMCEYCDFQFNFFSLTSCLTIDTITISVPKSLLPCLLRTSTSVIRE